MRDIIRGLASSTNTNFGTRGRAVVPNRVIVGLQHAIRIATAISAGSEAGINGEPGATTCGGTKGFLHAFMCGVAEEQGQFGVRANCVCPGPIDTAWTHKETGAVDEEIEKSLIAATPLGRRGTPEEVANVYAFLASDAASFVNSALWLVDGGITPGRGAVGFACQT